MVVSRCRLEAREPAGENFGVSSGLPQGSDAQNEQSILESPPKQDVPCASSDTDTASHKDAPASPSKAGASEPEASASLHPSSPTASDSSSPEAGNSQAEESSSAESQAAVEPVLPAVQQADSASGSNTPQLSPAADRLALPFEHATSAGAPTSDASSAAANSGGLAGTSAGVGGSSGEHGDDASSVRSQDTTASRASKIQASEMSRLQVLLAGGCNDNPCYHHSGVPSTGKSAMASRQTLYAAAVYSCYI